MRRLLISCALVGITAFATAGVVVASERPAAAAAVRASTSARVQTVWIDVRVNSAWPVRRAVGFVDRYTGSQARFGRCHAGSRCIVIRESWRMPSQWGAVTRPGYPKTTLTLNPHRRWTSWSQRLHILVHELGHAYGLYTHPRSCTSIMYHNVHCRNGRLAPLLFTTAQRRTMHYY